MSESVPEWERLVYAGPLTQPMVIRQWQDEDHQP